MGKPGIPSYGKDFRLEQLPYVAEMAPFFASRRYVMKDDEQNYIRSNPNSKEWYVFYHGGYVAKERTLRAAMVRMLTTARSMQGE